MFCPCNDIFGGSFGIRKALMAMKNYHKYKRQFQHIWGSYLSGTRHKSELETKKKTEKLR